MKKKEWHEITDESMVHDFKVSIYETDKMTKMIVVLNNYFDVGVRMFVTIYLFLMYLDTFPSYWWFHSIISVVLIWFSYMVAVAERVVNVGPK